MDALNNYVSFIRRIQKPDYTTNSTVDFKSKNRGYNYPWVADFWFTMFRTTGNKQYLKDGYGTLRAQVRYFKQGFYCININFFIFIAIILRFYFQMKFNCAIRKRRGSGQPSPSSC